MSDKLLEFGFCYLLTNLVNGKRYVGQTIRPLGERMDDYRRCEWCSKETRALVRAIKKYGWHNFHVAILAEGVKTQDALDALETYYIRTLDTMTTGDKGYNETEGGKGGKRSNSVKKKIAAGKLGKKTGPQTPKHRAAISEGMRGKPKSAEHRAKLSASNTGKTHSPETRAKLREINLGKTHTTATREKIGAISRGKKQSPEHVEKRASKLRGKPQSSANRAAISAGVRERHRVMYKHRALNELRAIGWPMQRVA